MRDEHLTHQRLFGQTPKDFSLRIERTLNRLKGDRPMKKRIGGALIIAAMLLLLCAAAVAAVQGSGLEWFYAHVFRAPTMPDNVDQTIQNEICQTVVEEHPLLHLRVESAVWLPKEYDLNYPSERTLEVLFFAAPKDSSEYEVHPWMELNRAGAYGEDTLCTQKGSGPVREVMTNPGKTLLLFSPDSDALLTMAGSQGIKLPISFCYHTYDDAGNILGYFSFHISDDLIDTLKTYADKGGVVSLLYTDRSWLWNKQGDQEGLTHKGTVSFQIKLPD